MSMHCCHFPAQPPSALFDPQKETSSNRQAKLICALLEPITAAFYCTLIPGSHKSLPPLLQLMKALNLHSDSWLMLCSNWRRLRGQA